MSWDAYLHDDRGHEEHEAGYTHNTNRMIKCALLVIPGMQIPLGAEIVLGKREPIWYDRLNGMSGEDGAKFLDAIISEFEAFPDYYRRMNPENGWGDFDSLLGVLKGMRDAVPTGWPTKWSVRG